MLSPSAWRMSRIQKVSPSLTLYHDSGCEEPSLTDEEAALILLELRKGVVLFPLNLHRQHESRILSQKPMHDDSCLKISDPATDMNNDEQDATAFQSSGHDPDLALAEAPSYNEYSGLSETSSMKFLGHDLDGTGGAFDNWYHKTNPLNRADHDSHGTCSDIPSDSEYHTARETAPSERFDHDSDATISDRELENKAQYARDINPSTIVDYDSDATISDPELEDKYRYELETTFSTMIDHDSDAIIPDLELGNNISHPREPSLATAAQPLAKKSKNTARSSKTLTPRHSSL